MNKSVFSQQLSFEIVVLIIVVLMTIGEFLSGTFNIVAFFFFLGLVYYIYSYIKLQSSTAGEQLVKRGYYIGIVLIVVYGVFFVGNIYLYLTQQLEDVLVVVSVGMTIYALFVTLRKFKEYRKKMQQPPISPPVPQMPPPNPQQQ